MKVLTHSLVDAAWALMIPVIILGGIYSGLCTATEAAGISAIYAAFVGLVIYRELDFSKIMQACAATAVPVVKFWCWWQQRRRWAGCSPAVRCRR